MTDWTSLSARASFASHRLIGWIYWDPGAIERYTALGVPDGFGYYVASRGAPLAPAGHQAVAAAFYSIHPGFIELCLATAAQHTTFAAIIEARNAAVGDGLRTYAPEICDGLADLGPRLWDAADALPVSGRVLFAAHRECARPEDPVVSAWLAVNCIREWRGDTHFAVLAANDLSGTQAGVLHNAHLNYPEQWIPRSRGADDDALGTAMADLEAPRPGHRWPGQRRGTGAARRDRDDHGPPVRASLAAARRGGRRSSSWTSSSRSASSCCHASTRPPARTGCPRPGNVGADAALNVGSGARRTAGRQASRARAVDGVTGEPSPRRRHRPSAADGVTGDTVAVVVRRIGQQLGDRQRHEGRQSDEQDTTLPVGSVPPEQHQHRDRHDRARAPRSGAARPTWAPGPGRPPSPQRIHRGPARCPMPERTFTAAADGPVSHAPTNSTTPTAKIVRTACSTKRVSVSNTIAATSGRWTPVGRLVR